MVATNFMIFSENQITKLFIVARAAEYYYYTTTLVKEFSN